MDIPFHLESMFDAAPWSDPIRRVPVTKIICSTA